jgi:hypothetical protein
MEQQFVALFMKNSYVALQDQQAHGEISDLHVYTYKGSVARPAEWTVLVSMRYPKAAGGVPATSTEAIRRLFANRETYELEKVLERQLIETQWDILPEELN